MASESSPLISASSPASVAANAGVQDSQAQQPQQRTNLKGRSVTRACCGAIGKAINNNKLALTLLAVAIIAGTFAGLGYFNVLSMPDYAIYSLAGGSAASLLAATMIKCSTCARQRTVAQRAAQNGGTV